MSIEVIAFRDNLKTGTSHSLLSDYTLLYHFGCGQGDAEDSLKRLVDQSRCSIWPSTVTDAQIEQRDWSKPYCYVLWKVCATSLKKSLLLLP